MNVLKVSFQQKLNLCIIYTLYCLCIHKLTILRVLYCLCIKNWFLIIILPKYTRIDFYICIILPMYIQIDYYIYIILSMYTKIDIHKPGRNVIVTVPPLWILHQLYIILLDYDELSRDGLFLLLEDLHFGPHLLPLRKIQYSWRGRYIYRVSQNILCLTFLLISQLILIVERWVEYPQNWDGKRFLTICDSTFSVTWFTRKLTFYEKFWPLLKGL